MPCYHPLNAYQNGDKRPTFRNPDSQSIGLQLPCGQCIGCRLERSRQWATRCLYESQLHSANCFVTLTYDDAHYPYHGDLHYPDFQKFARALRDAGKSFSYMVAGEYGGKLGRPHWHALLFGTDWPDKIKLKEGPGGHPIFRSAELESFWTKGYSSVGAVTFESAAYVARYALKKVTGKQSSDHYRRVDQSTGEIYQLTPEFCRMSTRPGIALDWYNKYQNEVILNDTCIVNGQETKPPRYFDKKLEVQQPLAYIRAKERRKALAQARLKDQTPARLAVREQVTAARLSFKKRTIGNT